MKKICYTIREWVKFNFVRPVLLGIGNVIGRYSRVGDIPIFSNQQFQWTEMLEVHSGAIRKELEGILALRQALPSLQEIQQEQWVLNKDQQWKTFFLYGFGIKANLNCKACPVTTSVLEQIPGMKTAFFSILSPKKHIPAHKGIFKGLIRSHLGLIVPGKVGDCTMHIADQKVNWREGEVVVFDDTYEHEVWNNTDKTRVVLLVDVVRPFKYPLSAINDFIVKLISRSSYVTDAMRKHQAWENRFHDHLKNETKIGLNT